MCVSYIIYKMYVYIDVLRGKLEAQDGSGTSIDYWALVAPVKHTRTILPLASSGHYPWSGSSRFQVSSRCYLIF